MSDVSVNVLGVIARVPATVTVERNGPDYRLTVPADRTRDGKLRGVVVPHSTGRSPESLAARVERAARWLASCAAGSVPGEFPSL